MTGRAILLKLDITIVRKIDFLSEQIPSAIYHDIPNDQLIKNPDNDSDWYLI